MNLEEFVKTTKLFELYSEMLSLNQLEVLSLYIEKNLSISEIAELNKTSRQAVFKIVNSAIKKLNNLEESLKIFKKQTKILQKLENMESNLNIFSDQQNIISNQNLKEIQNIIKQIKEDL